MRAFETTLSKAMETFEAGIDDVHSYVHYPQSHRVRISSTNPLERLNLEIRRRTRVIGMLLVEKHEDWLTNDKAYLTLMTPWRRSQRTRLSLWQPINEEGDFTSNEGAALVHWDLTLSRQKGGGQDGSHGPTIPAPESVLRSLPNVAVSSAQVTQS